MGRSRPALMDGERHETSWSAGSCPLTSIFGDDGYRDRGREVEDWDRGATLSDRTSAPWE